MSYNTELQSNNADLQAILDAVNALPETKEDSAYQDKTVTPTKQGMVVLPDDGYDALGKVFISGDGELVPENIKAGVEIFGVTGSMEEGIDTSDATATAGDIVSGATAYVNGEKITGTIKKNYGGISKEVEPSVGYGSTGPLVQLSYTLEEPSYISPSTGGVYLKAPFEKFGDATAEDVAKGKTFTSAAGLKAVGTREESGGGSAETCTVTFDNESISWDCAMYAIIATVLEDGERKTYVNFTSDLVSGVDNLGMTFTIPNVVCGTKIYMIASIYNYAEYGAYVEIAGSATHDSNRSIISNCDRVLFELTAPSVADEHCTIYYSYNV